MTLPGTPILAVDIDGVVNALGNGVPAPGWGDMLVCRSEGAEPPRLFRLRFRPEHGQKLLAVAAETGAELVWCSRWHQMANHLMRHLIGLPELPWVPMRASKAEALIAYAARRPVCWLDDEPDWPVEDVGQREIITVNAETGLSDADLEAARTWLASLRVVT